MVELVCVVERYALHRRQGELSQVHSTILCIGDAYAIHIDTHMLRTERTHVDSFQTAESTIVLNLHPSEILQRISHRCVAQCL